MSKGGKRGAEQAPTRATVRGSTCGRSCAKECEASTSVAWSSMNNITAASSSKRPVTPFSTIAALAAGTPVMAFDRGSVREVLDDPQTAIIGTNVDQLVSRFPELKNIKRIDCVKRVQENFSVEKMVDGYEQLYKGLMAKS